LEETVSKAEIEKTTIVNEKEHFKQKWLSTLAKTKNISVLMKTQIRYLKQDYG